MDWKDIGIELNGRTGQFKDVCPECKEENALSINTDIGCYKCHRGCMSGYIDLDLDEALATETTEDLTATSIEYLRKRALSIEVAVANGMASFSKGVTFPYMFEGVLVKTKYKDISTKNYTQTGGGKHCLYNHDRATAALELQKCLIITEGEEDAVAFEEIGYIATSVDGGAPNEKEKKDSKRLECIEVSYQLIDDAPIIYIAVDNDGNGGRLEAELIRRCSPEKCKTIDFSPWKDSNEVLLYEGKESLLERLESAKDVKIEGIFTGEEDIAIMDHYFEHGKPKGTTTYFPEIDECWTWRTSDLNMWIGYNNEGKSTFLRHLALVKSLNEGKKWAVYCPEDMPRSDFYDDLIEMYVGKTTDPDNNKSYRRMSREEYVVAREFVMKHFIILEPEGLADPDTLLDMIKYCVGKYGIYGYWLDPYNCIDHDYGTTFREDLYISTFMTKLKKFTVRHELVGNLTAHLTTPRKGEDGRYPKPDKYYVKGGGTFSDKCDNMLSIWRPNYPIDRSDSAIIFESQKVRKQKLVGIPGTVDMDYNAQESRYKINNISPLESLVIPDKDVILDVEENVQNLLSQSKYSYK